MTAAVYFDSQRGLLNPAVFSDPAIHRHELTWIFGLYWLFLGPVRWAADPGDFFTTTMGEIPVLVWHGPDRIRAFVNRCAGSGRLLTEEARGSANQLRCPCHGWIYAQSRQPGTAWPEEVPRLDRLGDLVFGCFDAEARPLADTLGDFAPYVASMLGSLPGGIEAIGGRPLVTRIAGNWKLGAEAHSGDLYRDLVLERTTHEAAGDGFQAATDAGAVVMAYEPATAGMQDAQAGPFAGLRPLTATLFPNLSFDGRTHALHVWHPRGPDFTDLATYALAGRADTADRRAARQRQCQSQFGPMGWQTGATEALGAAVTNASRGPIARGHMLNLQMGLGRERRSNMPGRIAELVSENNQRQFYAWWSRAMAQGNGPGSATRAAPRRTLCVVQPGGTRMAGDGEGA